ncbi:MAG: hypothetical protein ACFFAJ_13095, partial [Candidatus Hodarchaeota archaeon]
RVIIHFKQFLSGISITPISFSQAGLTTLGKIYWLNYQNIEYSFIIWSKSRYKIHILSILFI